MNARFALFSFATVVLLTSVIFAQQPLTIDTQYGQFVFSGRIVREKYGYPKLKGEILNNTSKDWLNGELEVSYYDSHGSVVPVVSNTLRFNDLLKGKSVSLGFGDGEIIMATDFRRRDAIAKFSLKFKNGTFPAKYTFVLLGKPKWWSWSSAEPVSNDLAFSDGYTSFT